MGSFGRGCHAFKRLISSMAREFVQLANGSGTEGCLAPDRSGETLALESSWKGTKGWVALRSFLLFEVSEPTALTGIACNAHNGVHHRR